MANNNSNPKVIKGAQQALDQMKMEVAQELGIDYEHVDKGDLPARMHGRVGGNMVKRMIAFAEQQMAQQNANGATMGSDVPLGNEQNGGRPNR